MQENDVYLNALLEGNNKIVMDIYQKFYPKVCSFVIRNSGKESDAQDVFHDALMYLIITHKENALQLNSFEGYLFTICKNIWRRTLKNNKKWVTNNDIIPLIDKEEDLSFFILEQQRLEFYQEKFQLLSNNCKEILSNYFNGMSYSDILKELSYASINTVRQRVFKCKAKIIKLIKADSRFHKLCK